MADDGLDSAVECGDKAFLSIPFQITMAPATLSRRTRLCLFLCLCRCPYLMSPVDQTVLPLFSVMSIPEDIISPPLVPAFFTYQEPHRLLDFDPQQELGCSSFQSNLSLEY